MVLCSLARQGVTVAPLRHRPAKKLHSGLALLRPALHGRSPGATLGRRFLGDSVAGPPITDWAGNLKCAQDFFRKGAISYAEYKQQCVSLRLFIFGGVNLCCALSLFIFPPKSSYWATWSPLYWFSHLRGAFTGSAPPLFLTKKLHHDVDVVALAMEAEAEYYRGYRLPSKKGAALELTSKETAAPPDRVTAEAKAMQPRVLFVLGGPGAGKGTQCANICENFPEWMHISAGDCLRAERQDPNSKDGELINTFIKEGKIVPVEITVKLLQKAMARGMTDGKSNFLIDGFPRNVDNVTGWESVVGESADVLGVLFFDATEEEMESRLLGRGQTSGRSDDNIESIKKRFRTYRQETMPIIDKYKQQSMVYTVDGMQTVDEVWSHTRYQIRKMDLVAKFGP